MSYGTLPTATVVLLLALPGLNLTLPGLATVAAAKEIAIGAKGPDFSGVGVDGKTYTKDSFKDADVLVLSFTCNDCPVAKAYEERFMAFAKKYEGKKVQFVAINCNNQTEDLAAMKKYAKAKGFNFTYIFDASGDSARAYGARVTPHLFALDQARLIAYRGAFDDSQRAPKTPHLDNAVTSILAGKKPAVDSTRAVGCGIKLKRKAP